MAWTTPLTAVANAALTAAQWNASVRDNLLETAPGISSAAGSIFVSSGTNVIAQRTVSSDTIETVQTTTSTSYTDLATTGPLIVNITTGALALLMYSAYMSNSTTNTSYVGWDISGSTSVSTSDNTALRFQSGIADQALRSSNVRRLTGLTPGTQTVTLRYRCSGTTSTFANRHIIVMGL